MEFIFLGFGVIGLPVIFAYLDLKYGFKEIFDFTFKHIKAIYLYFATSKYKKRKFELNEIGTTNYENSLKVFANELNTKIYDPKTKSINSFVDIVNCIHDFTTYQDKDGLEFLDRVSLIIKDKTLYEKFINVENIIRDIQYFNASFDIFKRDLQEPLLQLIDKINEYEIEIHRIENKFSTKL